MYSVCRANFQLNHMTRLEYEMLFFTHILNGWSPVNNTALKVTGTLVDVVLLVKPSLGVVGF